MLLIVVFATVGISAFASWTSPMLRDWVDAFREGRRWAPLAMADPRDSSGVAEIRDRGAWRA